MTKSNESTYTNSTAKGGEPMDLDLLEPRYSQADLARLEELRSRINVARALLAARVAHGLTQEELGKAAGTKQSRVSEIEAMKGNPRFDTLDRVARCVGLMVALVPRTPRPVSQVVPVGYRQAIQQTTVVADATGNSDSAWNEASSPLGDGTNG